MRTFSEHISGQIRRAGKRFKRFARAAMGRVRHVLKHVRGGLSNRHVEEVSICAPATTARCHTGKAEQRRGLPDGKPVSISSAPNAGDISAHGRVLSFQTKITHSRAIDARNGETGFDLMRPSFAQRHLKSAPLLKG